MVATASAKLKTVSAQISQKSVGTGRPAAQGAADALRAVGAEKEHEHPQQAIAGTKHAEGGVVGVDERRQQPADGERKAERTQSGAQPGEVGALSGQPRAPRRRIRKVPLLCRSRLHPLHSSPPTRRGRRHPPRPRLREAQFTLKG